GRLVPGGAETHRIAGLTHVLRGDTGRPTLGAYRRLLREPVDPALLALVASWLTRHLDATRRETPVEARPASS
ncbi:alpha/beta hydrolase, partial [Streptomyces sp. 4F]